LVLVRRDNVEHLVMIGGPTDVVVEANIAKAGPLSRGTAIVGDPEPAATLAHTLPRPEDGAEESWPLQPQQPAAWPRASRKVADENIPLMHDEFQARPAHGPARPQESAPLPLAPEPPEDPLSQRKGRSMPTRPPLVEPRAEAAKDHGQAPGVRHQQPSERSVSWPPQLE
jgi:flagellar protein FliO/FliZ